VAEREKVELVRAVDELMVAVRAVDRARGRVGREALLRMEERKRLLTARGLLVGVAGAWLVRS
jgi:hypothetical protein